MIKLASRAKRLYLLDLLRGLASLSVVLWHYQHLFYVAPFTLPESFSRAQQPFYSEFSLFYNEGSRAVQLFFVLSGFIFFFQYVENLRLRTIGFREFALLRFSRLYPLHAATLVAVAIGQYLYRNMEGHLFVYGCNDWKRFLLSAAFITDWLPSARICPAFNGPTWSLSVEIFLYAIFFVFARLLPKDWRVQLLWTFAAVLIGLTFFELDGFHLLGEPVFCFFSGGICCLLWLRGEPKKTTIIALLLLTASTVYTYLFGASTEILGIVLFPSTVLVLASTQNLHHNAGRSVRLVGDLTYSTYVLHFPLQLAIGLLVASNAVTLNFNSPLVWLAFFSTLIAISTVSYYFFERPLQRLLRNSLSSRPQPQEVIAPDPPVVTLERPHDKEVALRSGDAVDLADDDVAGG
jgi:peptidoglycan/LPS O-acetylase OafA/YrhL